MDSSGSSKKEDSYPEDTTKSDFSKNRSTEFREKISHFERIFFDDNNAEVSSDSKVSKNISEKIRKKVSHFEHVVSAKDQRSTNDKSRDQFDYLENHSQATNNKEIDTFDNLGFYKVRSGTNDSGRIFEYRTLAFFLLRCLNLQNIKNFWCSSNAEGVGSFDDNILHLQCENANETLLFQMKHKEKPTNITKQELLADRGDFSLKKYFSVIVKLKTNIDCGSKGIVTTLGTFESIKFVIFTNRGVNDVQYLEKVSSKELLSLNTSGGNCVYKVDLKSFLQAYVQNCSKSTEPKSEDIDLTAIDYSITIYLFVNQTSVENLKNTIEKELVELTKKYKITQADFKTISQKFERYVSDWAKGDLGGHYYLKKQDVTLRLFEFFLDKYNFDLKHRKCSFYESAKKEIWNRVVLSKTITIVDAFDDTIFTFLEEYVGSEVKKYHSKMENKWNDNLSNAFLPGNKNLKRFLHLFAGKAGNVTMLDIYKCLWFDNKISLLLQIESREDYQNILRIFGMWNINLNVIIINKAKFRLRDIENIKAQFVTLSDLNPLDRNEILNQFVSLQGRSRIRLTQLIDQSMYHHVKCQDIINILSKKYNIGGTYKPVEKPYIERSLFKVRLKFEALNEIRDEIFIIQTKSDYNTELKGKLQHLILQDVSNIFITEKTDLSIIKISNKLKFKITIIHRLVFEGEDWLEWIESLGDIKNIRKFLLNELKTVNTANEIWHNISNRLLNTVHIIIGPPGIGKSTFIDFISNVAPVNMWVLKIVLIHHNDYYKAANFKEKTLTDHLNYFNENILTQYQCINVDLAKAVFQKLLREKKIIILMDGYDEVSFSYKNQVTEIARCLQENELHTHITSRSYLKPYLEEQFNTISKTFQPFTMQNQEAYLFKYFIQISNTYQQNLERNTILNKFIKTLLKATETNLNDENCLFTGVPLHIKLLAEVFGSNLETSLKNNTIGLENLKNFDLLYLYEELFKRKADILCMKYGDSAKEICMYFDNHQKLLALQFLFDANDLFELNIDKLLMEYYKHKEDKLQNLQKEGLLVVETIATKQLFKINFVHHTCAEFLAAQWIGENYNTRNVKSTAVILFNKRFDDFSNNRNYIFLFKMFDCIYSKGFALHNAIINNQVSKIKDIIKSHPDELQIVDKAQRSFLHLMALYKTNNFEDILDKIPCHSIPGIIKRDIFEYNPLDYALASQSFAIANKICEKSDDVSINIVPDKFDEYFEYCNEKLSKKLLLHFICSKLLGGDISEKTTIAECLQKLNCLHYKNNVSTVSQLLEDYKIKSLNGNHYHELRFAITFGTEKNVYELLSNEDAEINKCRFGYTALHCAVKSNRFKIVKDLLSKGAEINILGMNGETPLHFACKTGHKDIVKTLILRNAAINIRNKNLQTPLLLALKSKHIGIVNLLILKNANVNVEDRDGNSCLHLAAHFGLSGAVLKFIDMDLDINKKNANGRTPLYFALCNNQMDTAELLISKGAVSNDYADQSNFCLQTAASLGRNDIILDLIQKGIDINAQNKQVDTTKLPVCKSAKDSKTALDLALTNTHMDTVELLIQNGASSEHYENYRSICLFLAIRYGQETTVLDIINKGVNINELNANGETPLLLALKSNRVNIAELLIQNGAICKDYENYGSLCLFLAIRHGQENIAFDIINKGVDINEPNTNNETPLFSAIKNKQKHTANLLIAKGANVDDFCLHLAVALGQEDIVRSLILKGVDINKTNNNNETPLSLAFQHKHIPIVKLLLSQGAHTEWNGNSCLDLAVRWGQHDFVLEIIRKRISTDRRHIYDKAPLCFALENLDIFICKLLLAHGADFNVEDKMGNSCLHWAAKMGYKDIVYKLINLGLDINKQNKNGETPLILAVYNKQINIVKALIEHHADLNLKDIAGNSCLHVAAKRGQNDILSELIRLDLNVNEQNKSGKTPLFSAIECKQIDAVMLLIKNRANVIIEDIQGNSCLHFAAEWGSQDIISKLIQLGLDVNKRNKNGETPLFFTIYNNQIGAMNLLTKHSADINIEDAQGNSCLHVAAKWGQKDIVSKLIQLGVKVDKQNGNGKTPLFLAIEFKQTDAACLLLINNADVNIQDVTGNSCLHVAARNGYKYIIPQLIELGIEISKPNKNGETPLFLAIAHKQLATTKLLIKYRENIIFKDFLGNSCLHKATEWGHKDIISELIRSGHFVNQENNNKETPLFFAIYNNHLDAMKLLIEHGADMNISDSPGNTCLHVAAAWGHKDILFELVQLGLDINKQNKNGQTPLFFAIIHKQIDTVQLLIDNHADVSIEDIDDNTLLHEAATWGDQNIISKLIELGLDVNKRNKKGETPIFSAIEYDRISTTKLLIELDADINVVDAAGNSCLHVATKWCQNDTILELIRLGFDVNKQNNYGETPLFWAVDNNKIEAVKLLIEQHADVKIKDADGNSCLYLAIEKGAKNITQLLQLKLNTDKQN